MRKKEQDFKDELDRFIEFGNILDKRSRQYITFYILEKLNIDLEWDDNLESRYFKYFKSALNDLLDSKDLLEITQNNKLLGYQVASDTVKWLRKTYEKVADQHPYDREQDDLENWQVRHIKHMEPGINPLLNNLHGWYEPSQLDTTFYREKFKALFREDDATEKGSPTAHEVERILTDLLTQWDALLYAKIFKFQINKMKPELENFEQELDAKAREYKKLSSLIDPVNDYLSRYWDMSNTLWDEKSFNILEKYQQLLKDYDSIKKLADLLGRFREAETEIEEEAIEKKIVRFSTIEDPFMRSEITGVHEGKDLNHMLSSESGLLGNAETEDLFLKKYADEKLLSFYYNDKRTIQDDISAQESEQHTHEKEKGPFIICVDTSGSMEGEEEIIAKVLCFAILKMTASDNRSAFLINFSSGIKTINLHDVTNSMDDIAQFLNMSFLGGTDISLAMHSALDMLKTNDYKDADVLVISDFIMYKIQDDILREMSYQRHHHDTQFHSMIISDQGNPEVIDKFDNSWVYDPEKKGIIKETLTTIKDIHQRKL